MPMNKQFSPESEVNYSDDLLGKNPSRRKCMVPKSDNASATGRRKRLKDCGDSL